MLYYDTIVHVDFNYHEIEGDTTLTGCLTFYNHRCPDVTLSNFLHEVRRLVSIVPVSVVPGSVQINVQIGFCDEPLPFGNEWFVQFTPTLKHLNFTVSAAQFVARYNRKNPFKHI